MQSQPFLCLLHAVVVKFVVHSARPQRLNQVAPDLFGKLARVNGDIDERWHTVFLSKIYG